MRLTFIEILFILYYLKPIFCKQRLYIYRTFYNKKIFIIEKKKFQMNFILIYVVFLSIDSRINRLTKFIFSCTSYSKYKSIRISSSSYP